MCLMLTRPAQQKAKVRIAAWLMADLSNEVKAFTKPGSSTLNSSPDQQVRKDRCKTWLRGEMHDLHDTE